MAETFELGFKSELGDNLRLNAAVFGTDYEQHVVDLSARHRAAAAVPTRWQSSIEGGGVGGDIRAR